MKKCTLVIPRRDGKIWLAVKKHKVGAGLLNGWGGKVNLSDRDNLELCAIREFNEETRTAQASAHDLEKAGIIDFYEFRQHIFQCHIYFLKDWEGEIQESTEMGPPEVFDENA